MKTEDKMCFTCAYFYHDTDMLDGDFVCVNDKSDNLADYILPDQNCNQWERNKQSIEAKFVGNNLVINMPENQYHAVADILEGDYRMTLEDATQKYLEWMVSSRDEFVQWIKQFKI